MAGVGKSHADVGQRLPTTIWNGLPPLTCRAAHERSLVFAPIDRAQVYVQIRCRFKHQ